MRSLLLGLGMKRPVHVLAFLATVCPGLSATAQSNAPPAPAGEDLNWRQVESIYRERFTEPTEAVPVDRLVLPWEPAEAVVVVLPLSQVREFPGVQRIIRDILAAVLPEMPVVALYHELDHRLLGDWLLLMEDDPEVAPHLERMEFLATEAFSIWARDFTPVFARGYRGHLVAVDASFLPSRRLMNLLQRAKMEFDPGAQWMSIVEASRELHGMRGSDVVPAVLAPFIEARWQAPVALSRAPVYLLGGDFLPVDGKRALVSFQTLEENGGDRSRMDETLRSYYGVETAVYLENLPGDTIEHLDFIALPVAPDVILAAQPPSSLAGERPFHRLLERELRTRLERNRAALQRAFPDHRIVDVPMPPPLLDSDAEVVDELFLHSVERVAESRGLPFRRPPSVDALDPQRLDPRLVEAVNAELGIRNWQTEAARRSGVEFYLGRPVEPLIRRHVEEHVHYRSYINSLHVRNTEGAELVLVPRYRPASEAEAELFRTLEADVEAAYREALPDAQFHWIDCTDLAEFLGALHCLTATIPQMQPAD